MEKENVDGGTLVNVNGLKGGIHNSRQSGNDCVLDPNLKGTVSNSPISILKSKKRPKKLN